MPKPKPIKDRLLSKRKMVSGPLETPCWEYQGARTRDGYGFFKVSKGRMVRAHRVSYETFIGPIPNGLHVLHKCDQRSCFNPDHLFVGTNADNCADCVAKDRQTRGSRNGRAKLTETDVIRIRNEIGTSAKLAAKFGISRSLVSLIRQHKVWKCIPKTQD